MGFSENMVPQNPLVKIICPLNLLRYRGMPNPFADRPKPWGVAGLVSAPPTLG